ncbi:hypothetical protein [Rariglobus hedericola]|uniref:Uncharacterized protein n=1 Tax=Rariglobus hedericola TaxID=2597822 RepID=A0A556QN59_9BACT|nr:hypothetical protein [Rariglobus hedericola]TSJ78088.1 hypothetical protein FPL22_01900 [Rariglobus hedericola]
MNLQTFFTLLVIGVIVGVLSALTGKGKTALPVALVVSCAGAFLGWFVFTQVSRMAMQVIFAIGGSLLLLWLARLIKK